MPVSTNTQYINTKAALNVSCWYCEHFQRYDRGEPELLYLAGECRFTAPLVDTSDALQKDKNYYSERKWGIIMAPDQTWCAKFARSSEVNIPDPNPVGPPPTPLGAWDFFQQGPWNKKIKTGYVATPGKGIACWNCDHFEPYPLIGAGAGAREEQVNYGDSGECRFKPPYPFKRGEYDNGTLYEWNRFPYLWKAHCYWCAKWERAQRDAGDPPASGAGSSAQDAWDCPYPPNGNGESIELTALNVSGDIKTAETATKAATKKRTTKKTK